MTTPDPQYDADLIQARYGHTRRTNRKPVIAVAALVSIIGIALMIWIGLGLAKPQATSTVISFNVVDPGLTTIHFEVSKPEDKTAECVIEALSTGFAQVGVKTVTIGPSETLTTTLFEEVKTSEEATTAIIDHCSLID